MRISTICFTALLFSLLLPADILVESSRFTIPEEEFNQAWESIPLEVKDYYLQKEHGKQEFLMDLIRQRVFAEAAREIGLDEEYSCKNQIAIATNQVLAQNYIDRIIRYPILTPEALQTKYDSIKSEFARQGWYEASHILVTPRPTPDLNNETGDDALTGKQARTKVEKILALLNNGIPFEQVARQYSEDPKTTLAGGDLGHFSPGTMVKEVEAALDRMERETTSGIIQTEFGFHILYLKDRQSAGPPSLEDLMTRVQTLLLLQESGVLKNRENMEFNDLKEKQGVKINWDAIWALD